MSNAGRVVTQSRLSPEGGRDVWWVSPASKSHLTATFLLIPSPAWSPCLLIPLQPGHHLCVDTCTTRPPSELVTIMNVCVCGMGVLATDDTHTPQPAPAAANTLLLVFWSRAHCHPGSAHLNVAHH